MQLELHKRVPFGGMQSSGIIIDVDSQQSSGDYEVFSSEELRRVLDNHININSPTELHVSFENGLVDVIEIGDEPIYELHRV